MHQSEIAVSRGRALQAAWLTLAAAAALLPWCGAQATTASASAEGADQPPTSASGPRQAIITSAREDLDRIRLSSPPQEVAAAEAEPEKDDAGAAVYGPPSPKVKDGKLGQVDWPPAPEVVPPALEQAINIVTRNYPSAKSARAALSAAHSDVRAAKWLRFPRVSTTVEYLDTRSDSNSKKRDLSLEPQVKVAVPIWAGGRIGAEIRRARAEEDVSSAGYVETVQTLALTTSQTYFEIARLVQREQLLADSLKEHHRLVETMERRVSQEVSPQADLELARSRSAQIEQEYTITRSQRLTALRVLAELVADPSYDLGPVPRYRPIELGDEEALEEQAIAYDPELRRLVSQVDVARAVVDARKSSILPQLDAQYSYDDIFKSRVGVVVTAQSTGGLSQFSEINSARLRVQAALEDVRVADQQLRREIAADLIELNAAKARASISTSASETAARVSESYMRQFIAGRRSWLDVMNALREAVTAQLGKTDAEVTVMAASVRLLLRSGRWRATFENPQ